MENQKKLMDKIKDLAPFGLLITLLMCGFALSSGYWSSIITKLQYDLNSSKEELANVKQEYAQYKNLHPEMAKDLAAPKENIKQNQADINLDGTSSRTIKLQEGTSLILDSDTTLSLVAIEYSGEPLRHRFTANISIKGKKTINWINKDIGDAISIKNVSEYDIRALEIDTFSTTFLINEKGQPWK